jgi:hypothetical protein
MSYNIDGKIANQSPDIKLSGKTTCSKCRKITPPPQKVVIESTQTMQFFICASYIGTDNFIYETKSGTAVVYCSEYCKRKHNHRFN